MRRLRNALARLKHRRRGTLLDERYSDAREAERLTAEYTGSFARNVGQECGIVPPRYGRR